MLSKSQFWIAFLVTAMFMAAVIFRYFLTPSYDPNDPLSGDVVSALSDASFEGMAGTEIPDRNLDHVSSLALSATIYRSALLPEDVGLVCYTEGETRKAFLARIGSMHGFLVNETPVDASHCPASENGS